MFFLCLAVAIGFLACGAYHWKPKKRVKVTITHRGWQLYENIIVCNRRLGALLMIQGVITAVFTVAVIH